MRLASSLRSGKKETEKTKNKKRREKVFQKKNIPFFFGKN